MNCEYVNHQDPDGYLADELRIWSFEHPSSQQARGMLAGSSLGRPLSNVRLPSIGDGCLKCVLLMCDVEDTRKNISF